MRHPFSVLVLVVGSLAVLAPASAQDPTPTCAGEAATIVGTAYDDELTGTDGPDVIVGLAGNDDIEGLAGDDVLCGGSGRDLLVGGDGDDALYGQLDEYYDHDPTDEPRLRGDTLVPGPGDDLVDLGADPHVPETGFPHDWYWYPDQLVLSGAPGPVSVDLAAGTVDGDGHDRVRAGFFEVDGTPYDDVLVGDDTRNLLLGGEGADTIDGAGGPDQLDGDEGDDVLHGGAGDDDIYPAGGVDQVDGGPGDDGISAADDDADVVHGGDGADRLYTRGAGADQLFGDAGSDELDVDLRPGDAPALDGGPGADTVALDYVDADPFKPGPPGTADLAEGTVTIGWPTPTTFSVRDASVLRLPYAHWTVWGTDGPDTIDGRGTRSLTAYARAGDDHLFGSNFVDHLDGGEGTDTARAGGEDDVCVDIEVTEFVGDTCDRQLVVGAADRIAEVDPSHDVGGGPRMSGDGRYLAFATSSALVAADTNGRPDVYVRDLRRGTTELASVTSSGAGLAQGAVDPDVSSGGRYVVFASRSPLVAGARSGRYRVYRHDRTTGRTTLVSADEYPARYPTISDDGRRVAFISMDHGVYVRDLDRARPRLVSHEADRYDFASPELSGDGQSVLFAHHGWLLRHLDSGSTERVADASYGTASISTDGHWVTYAAIDPYCSVPDPADCSQVMMRDVRAGDSWAVSTTPEYDRPNGGSYAPVLAGGRRLVMFTSRASDLTDGDDNGAADVFVYDRRTGLITLVSTGPDGSPGNGASGGGVFGGTGAQRRLAFDSVATDLVAGDDDDAPDLFVRSWEPGRRKSR